MDAQSLIYSKVTLPASQSEEMSKIFVVKDIDAVTGNVTAFLLTSRISKKNHEGNHIINPDKVNKLRMPSLIQTAREFVFPSDWDFTVMSGRIDDISFAAALGTQEQYKKNNEIIIVDVTDTAPEVDALRDQITELQNSFQADPNLLLEYLAFKAQFYNYSPRNSLMIYTQNRYATFVGSRTLYKKLGYEILPDQRMKGIEIVRPDQVEYFRRGGELIDIRGATRTELMQIANKEISTIKKTYFHPAHVYDISQTDCPVEDYPKVYTVGYEDADHRTALEHMIHIAETNGIKVTMEQLPSISLQGYYQPSTDSIVLNSRLKDTQALSTMNHEYAHAILHKTSTQPKDVKEFEAECLGYQLNKKMGLPPAEGSEQYIVSHLNKAQKDPSFKLDDSLKRISKPLNMIGTKLAALSQVMSSRNRGQTQSQSPQQNQESKKGKNKNASKLEQQQDKTKSMSISENFTHDL